METGQQSGEDRIPAMNRVLLDRDHSGNGGDTRGMPYHAKGGMRSAATDVPNRHADSMSTHPFG
jgi:hypothetical protein